MSVSRSMFGVKIEGVDAIALAVKHLPMEMKRREIALIARRAQKPILDHARATLAAHSKSGRAKKAIITRGLQRQSARSAGAFTGYSGPNRRGTYAPHWHWVEFGIAPIRPVISKKGLFKTKGLKNLKMVNGKYYRRVNIPGVGYRWIDETGSMTAIAPMRKAIGAWQAKTGKDFVAEMEKYTRRRLAAVMKKYGKK